MVAKLLRNVFGYSGRVTIGDVTLDASVYESHALEADTTDHPIEKGADRSDHYRARPRQVTIEGMISPVKIGTSFPGQTLVSSVKSIITGSDPVAEAWETFKKYFDTKELITITTKAETYTDMAIISIKSEKTSGRNSVLSFEMVAKHIKTVSVLTTDAIKIPAAVKSATAGKESGTQKNGRKPAKEAQPQQKTSMLAQGLDKVAGFF